MKIVTVTFYLGPFLSLKAFCFITIIYDENLRADFFFFKKVEPKREKLSNSNFKMKELGNKTNITKINYSSILLWCDFVFKGGLNKCYYCYFIMYKNKIFIL